MNNGQFNSETGRLAGQKSKRGTGQRVAILNDFFEANIETAKQIFLKVQEQALAGDTTSQKIYLEYFAGKPETKMDLTSDGEQILGFNYFPASRPTEYKNSFSSGQINENGNGLTTKSGTV